MRDPVPAMDVPSLPWLDALPGPALLLRGNQVVQANAAASQLLGQPVAALAGRATQEIFSGDAALALFGGPAGPPPQAQVQVQRPDDSPCTVELLARALPAATRPALTLVQLHDVTALVHSRQALEESHAELHRLALGLDTVLENERRRIAIELHDELQQSLVALQMELHVLSEQMAEPLPLAAQRLAQLGEQALTALASTRRIVNDLRPPILEDLGLLPALQALTRQFTQRTGIACPLLTSLHTPQPQPEHPKVATVLYRTAQEALANTARHAGATEAHVRYAQHPDGSVTLAVADNGQGLRTGDRRKPFTVGLRAMEERLRAAGGTLTLASDASGGTRVEARLPQAHLAPASPLPRPMPLQGASQRVADLLGFLYRTPVGLVQATLDGQIELINPKAARLLLPFTPHGPLDNLFQVLRDTAPHLQRLVANGPLHGGVICEGLQLQAPPPAPGRAAPGLTLHLFKQDGSCLMGVLLE